MCMCMCVRSSLFSRNRSRVEKDCEVPTYISQDFTIHCPSVEHGNKELFSPVINAYCLDESNPFFFGQREFARGILTMGLIAGLAYLRWVQRGKVSG